MLFHLAFYTSLFLFIFLPFSATVLQNKGNCSISFHNSDLHKMGYKTLTLCQNIMERKIMKKIINFLKIHVFFMAANLMLFTGPASVFAEIPKFPDSNAVFHGEIRSVICSASGYVYTGAAVGQEQARQRAIAVAKRFALRKTNTMIQKKLGESDSRFRFEFVEFQPGEYVRILYHKDVKPIAPGQTRLYGAQITAEIRYRITDVHNQEKLLSDLALPLTVRVWTQKASYREGEKIVFYIRGNRDFYAAMIDIAPDGEIIQILPNLHRKSHLFKRSVTYSFPDPLLGDNFDMNVSPPFGEETVLIYASEMPIGEIPFSKYAGQFGVVKGNAREVSDIVRKIVPKIEGLDTEAGSFSYVDFFESRWIIRTFAK